ncbi:hypothetical protein HK097_010770 [Rhizophlyctis rosea]|uniref:NADPH-dependent FMN reductase-like domain-containing protein n=1 Tax=Rhizophlyctis rosea TaxID=64517 RepID=A0AAD5WZK7_9FUNG|nr:hypothetical protein HK097_010770 [Rhizophlyctis rosea]
MRSFHSIARPLFRNAPPTTIHRSPFPALTLNPVHSYPFSIRLSSSSTKPFTYAIIHGSVRPNRLGERLVKFLQAEITERGDKALIVEANGIPTLEKKYAEYIAAKEEPPAGLHAIHENLTTADGFVVVTAEYNSTMPPGLTNVMDYFLPEYNRKPALISSYSYGIFGGIRASTAARSFLSNLGLITLPSHFPVPNLGDKVILPNGKLVDKSFKGRVKIVLDELDWVTDAIRSKRERDVKG